MAALWHADVAPSIRGTTHCAPNWSTGPLAKEPANLVGKLQWLAVATTCAGLAPGAWRTTGTYRSMPP